MSSEVWAGVKLERKAYSMICGVLMHRPINGHGLAGVRG